MSKLKNILLAATVVTAGTNAPANDRVTVQGNMIDERYGETMTMAPKMSETKRTCSTAFNATQMKASFECSYNDGGSINGKMQPTMNGVKFGVTYSF